MKRAVVTGAAGFIGSWLCARLLAQGIEVIAVVRRVPAQGGLFANLGLVARPGLRVLVQDWLSADDLVRLHPEAVFHLAGWSQVAAALAQPAAAFSANAAGTWTLLDTIRRTALRPRIVTASTDGVYGETGARPAVESDPLAALGPYEASKAAADIAARSFAKLYQLPLAVARLGNVYGPGDRNTARLMPALQDAVARGQRPLARGGGRSVRTYLHVRDCINALILLAQAAEHPDVRGEAFNVASRVPRSTLEVMRCYLEAAGRTDLSPIAEEGAPGEISIKISSSDKIRERLGWSESTPFEAGLRDVISCTFPFEGQPPET